MAPLVEICVDHVDGARIAEESGADRVEVCAGLVEGGTTPSIGMVGAVLRTVRRVGVQVLIRPRGGDFRYSPAELEVMAGDIAAVRALATEVTVGRALATEVTVGRALATKVTVGFVLGALTADGDIDVPATRALVACCGGAPVTFHKAFDATRDLDRSLDRLMELGIGRVLTSGGRARAVDGAPALAALVRRAAGRIAVVAGGAVRPHNVRSILARTGVPEVHLRATDPAQPTPATSAAVIAALLAEVRDVDPGVR